ncbi:MAG: hypothetical protein OXT72_12195 [Gammaproteobacteria bacterium]|nr:hypothetical protein [Gammaproteobacteria bacterium]MDE0246361.1 hypothetical protein [Gammaproteobacteria bacterium]
MGTTTRSGRAAVLPLQLAALALGSLLVLPGAAASQAQPEEVTFARDVAPILQEKCETCHRDGSIGPMPLTTYDEVRPWAPLIKEKVVSFVMPPWPIDRTIGIQRFKNDRSLSDEQIQTISDWADAGAPLGDVAELPAPLEWPEWSDVWRFEEELGRPPDLVVSSPAYMVAANSADDWPWLESPIDGLDEQRWIKAAEFRPGTADTWNVFHHANPGIVKLDGTSDGSLRQTRGNEGTIYADDSGTPLDPGDIVRWNMHMYAIDRDVDAVLQLGFWLYPKDEPPTYRADGADGFSCSQYTGHGFASDPLPWRFGPELQGGPRGLSTNPQVVRQGDLLLPPNSWATYRGVYVMDRAARLEIARAHLHLRGRYQILEAVYPDGRWEVINKFHFDHDWQTGFLYEDDAMPLFPKGTVLIVTGVFDNTADNPHNPDPDQWVVRGDRTVDSMCHFRMGLTYFESEEEFQAAVDEREALLRRERPVSDDGGGDE